MQNNLQKQLQDAIAKLSTSTGDIKSSLSKLLAVAVAQADGLKMTAAEFTKIIETIPTNLQTPEEFIVDITKKLGGSNEQLEKFKKTVSKINEELEDTEKFGNNILDLYEDLESQLRENKNVHTSITDEILKHKKKLTDVLGIQESSVVYTKLMAQNADVLSNKFTIFGNTLASAADFSTISDDFESLVDQLTAGNNLIDIRIDGKSLKMSATDAFKHIKNKSADLTTNLSADMEVNTSKMLNLLDGIRSTGNLSEQAIGSVGDKIQDIFDIVRSINSSSIDPKSNVEDINKQYSLLADAQIQLAELTNSSNSGLDDAAKLLLNQYNAQLELGIARQNDLDTLTKIKKTFLTNLHSIKRTAGLIDSATDKLEAFVSVLPKGVVSFLGIDDALASLRTNSQKAIETFYKQIAGGVPKTEALGAAFNQFGPAIRLALNPLTLMTLAIVGIYKLVESYDQKWKEISDTVGISLSQAKQLHKSSLALLSSNDNQLTTMEDILAIQTALVSATGSTLDLNKKSNAALVMNLAETAKLFGYTNEEASKFYGVMKTLGADDALVQTLQKTVGLAAEAAGLSAKMITNDLIEAASEVSIYYGGLPESAAAAAIQTRRLGMSLKQVGTIADKMLNIESFMTDMYEVAALTSGGIDLSKAFDMRMSGAPLEKVLEEVTNSIGSLADFNDQSEFTKRKLASTLDMTTEELANSLRLKDLHGQLDAESMKILQANLGTLGDISNVEASVLASKAKELQNSQRMEVAFTKIVKELQSQLLPLAEEFAEWLHSSEGFIDGIVGFVKGLMSGLQVVVGLVKLIGKGLEIILLPTTKFMEFISGTKKNLAGVNSEASALKSTGTALGAIFAGWLVTTKAILPAISGVKKVVGMLKPAGSAVADTIKDKVTDTVKDKVTDTVKDKVFGAGESMADKMGDYIKKIKPMDLIKVAGAMVIMSAALYVTAKALKEFNDVQWPSLAKGALALTGLTIGLLALSKIPVERLLIGSAALAIMGAALIPAAIAMNMFNTVDFDQLIYAGVAIGALTAAVFGLSFVAPAILVGAIALAAMGASLIPFAYAAGLTADAMEKLMPSLTKMQDLDLLSAAAGIAALGGALAAFGAGSGVNGLAQLFNRVTGAENPLETLSKLADIGQPLDIAAKAILNTNDALALLAETVQTMDFSKLDSLSKIKKIFVNAESNQNSNETVNRSTTDTTLTKSNTVNAKPPSPFETGQNLAIPQIPNPIETGQNLSIGPTPNSAPADPYLAALENSPMVNSTSQSDSKMDQLIRQLITEVQKLSERPILVQIGGRSLGILNSELKTLNNRNR
jgi:archaellum component FlaC